MKYYLILFSIIISSCISPNRNDALPPEPFRPKVYAASHIEGGIVRKQDNEVISCAQKEFSKFVCMSYTDIIRFQQLLNSCETFTNINETFLGE